MREPKNSRRRKAPKNTEWRGQILHGRKRFNGKLKRWSLRTGDVELARARVAEDIERLSAAAFYGDSRVKYRDVVASWAERHILHEVGPLTAQRYAVSLRQIEPLLLELFLDQIDKVKCSEIVDVRRADGQGNGEQENEDGGKMQFHGRHIVEPISQKASAPPRA